jgi:hypothetical protein
MPTQIEKLEGHCSHLLDAFIQLRERYALLEPMLFDEKVRKGRASGRGARGFQALLNSLFLSCAQDIAKLSFDKSERTPSISKLMAAISDHGLEMTLRDRFAVWYLPPAEDETDPEILEALRRIELREQDERRAQFDEILASARRSWDELSVSGYMRGFLTIRDKVTAHTEIQHVADKYQRIDISSLGVKWADLRRAIEGMQELVEALGLLIRNSTFAWDMLDAQLSKASKGFWLPSDAAT